jgi:tetratricopeptide (TPR) repeat protein
MTRRQLLSWIVVALWFARPMLSQAPSKPSPNTQPEPVFDPYKAEKSVEIGTFYLKKKNYDAAIERFLDALKYKANFARPHRLLGVAFEKKGEFEDAISHYKAYLEILPAADDANKIRKKITELERKLEKGKKRDKRAG